MWALGRQSLSVIPPRIPIDRDETAPEARGSLTGRDSSGGSRGPLPQRAVSLRPREAEEEAAAKVLRITSPVMSGSAGPARGCTGSPAKPATTRVESGMKGGPSGPLAGCRRLATPCHAGTRSPKPPIPTNRSRYAATLPSPSSPDDGCLSLEGSKALLSWCGVVRRGSLVPPPYSLQAVWRPIRAAKPPLPRQRSLGWMAGRAAETSSENSSAGRHCFPLGPRQTGRSIPYG